MSYGLYIYFADIHNSSTVLLYRLEYVLLCVHGRYATSLVVFYIFENLDTSTTAVYNNNSASLRLHPLNAASARTP